MVKLLLDHHADVNVQDQVTMHIIYVCMCTHQVIHLYILKDVHVSVMLHVVTFVLGAYKYFVTVELLQVPISHWLINFLPAVWEDSHLPCL